VIDSFLEVMREAKWLWIILFGLAFLSGLVISIKNNQKH